MGIKLYYNQLKHDIDQWTFRLADGRLKEDISVRDNAQADSTDADKAYYIRLIREGVAHLKAVLTDDIEKVTDNADDKLAKDTVWEFSFKDESEISCDSKALAEILHRFVLLHVMFDWAGTYAPDASQTISSQISETRLALDKSMYSMEPPVKHRRPLPEYQESITFE